MLIFKDFSNVYFPLTYNKHLYIVINLRCYYTSNKTKYVSLLLLYILIYSIKHHVYLRKIFNKK